MATAAICGSFGGVVMPISFQVDTARQLILTSAHGQVNFAEVMEYFRELRAHAQFQPTFFELFDLRATSGMSITAGEISQLAQIPVFAPAARRALVAQSALIFGLCRMFTAYCAANGQHNIGVFDNLPEARHWLGLADTSGAESLQIAS